MRHLDQHDQDLRGAVLEWLKVQSPKYDSHQGTQDDLLEMIKEWCDEHEQQVQRKWAYLR